MACKVVWCNDNLKLKGRKFASHAAVARALKEGQDCYVQETSGNWQGWYRQVGVSKDGKTYWTSRPLMEY